MASPHSSEEIGELNRSCRRMSGISAPAKNPVKAIRSSEFIIDRQLQSSRYEWRSAITTIFDQQTRVHGYRPGTRRGRRLYES
jgi:hypothetical protein